MWNPESKTVLVYLTLGGMENLLMIFQSIYCEKFAPMRRSIVAAEFIYFDP